MDPDLYSGKENLSAKLTKHRNLWRFSRADTLLAQFSVGERFLLYILTVLFASSAFMLVVTANSDVSVVVPSQGGTFTEGEVGPARFINPLLTLSKPDEDLSTLVYSGLMRATPDGSAIPDLASAYEVSEDGTVYTFNLRPNMKFHDGTLVTSEDVAFTVQRTQNSDFKSVRRADWEGVTVSTPDTNTIVFTLPHPYAPFIENTTLGILPKHLWQSVTAEEFPFSPLNTRPVGSGPFRIAHVTTDDTGAATEYILLPFDGYALGTPYLGEMTFRFYPNDESMIQALNEGNIDAIAGISPSNLSHVKRAGIEIVRVPLPRVFGVFFNQNKAPVLADAAVRQALDAAVDKQAIVDSVLGGYGTPIQGPIPPGVSGTIHSTPPSPFTNREMQAAEHVPNPERVEAVHTILTKGGWVFSTSTETWVKKKTPLTFSLATADEPELVATANEVARAWKDAGVAVDVHVYPLSELNAGVLRPRAYDAILFGEIVGRSMDLFAFWHSSQRNDPGLNLALYTNSKADTILSQARGTTDQKKREELYTSFAELIAQDRPAIFLYAPDFLYLVPESIESIELGALTTPAERFLSAHTWFSETERVWSIFTDNEQL